MLILSKSRPLIFNLPQPTLPNASRNDLLKEGKGKLNKLVEIDIKWYSHESGFHRDIEKIFNFMELKNCWVKRVVARSF